MAKVPGFAKAFADRWRIVETDVCDGDRLSVANADRFFNSLLGERGWSWSRIIWTRVENEMKPELVNLPWATLLTLASGYAGYFVANCLPQI